MPHFEKLPFRNVNFHLYFCQLHNYFYHKHNLITPTPLLWGTCKFRFQNLDGPSILDFRMLCKYSWTSIIRTPIIRSFYNSNLFRWSLQNSYQSPNKSTPIINPIIRTFHNSNHFWGSLEEIYLHNSNFSYCVNKNMTKM